MDKANKSDRENVSWEPPQTEETLRREERSLDIGESGQFAPGGYYNQQGVNEPRRNLDDDVIPPGRNSRRRD
jgi:hypothetical protein